MSVESFKAGLADILEVQEVTEQFELNPGNWDSTVQLAVIALIDENFGTTIPVKQIEMCTSVQSLLDLVQRQGGQRATS